MKLKSINKSEFKITFIHDCYSEVPPPTQAWRKRTNIHESYYNRIQVIMFYVIEGTDRQTDNMIDSKTHG